MTVSCSTRSSGNWLSGLGMCPLELGALKGSPASSATPQGNKSIFWNSQIIRLSWKQAVHLRVNTALFDA
jgi:hypothetical protein